MRVISRRTLRDYVESLAAQRDQGAVKAALDAWFHEASRADWGNTADIRTSFATASIIAADRVVFNVKGNDHRLIVAVDFHRRIVWVKWLGSHRDYDRIDARSIEHDG